MILNRFGVRGRLNLLLLLPVIAVLLVAAPLVVSQIDDARVAGRTADIAGQARQVSGLVWELQRELLVTSAYVATPGADPGTMLEQQRTVSDTAAGLRAALGPTASDELAGALTRLGSLNELRRNAVARGVSIDSVARTYHAVTEAVIDALRLIPKGAGGTASLDAESAKSLSELESLLRAGEYSALRGTALITASLSPVPGRKLLNDATANAQILTQRFVQQADVEHAALLVQVDQGEAGRKVEALTRQVPNPGDPAITPFVANALTSAESQASLRRTVQDRVTAEIADAAAARADAARGLAIAVTVGALALLAVVVLLSVIVSRSIANPLRQLTRSATTVADLTSAELTRVADKEDSDDSDEQVPKLAEVDVASGGEVGELAAAFNRVQSTAAALLDRQSSNRRNVSSMFANVARRTQNLVQRQLAMVDELERNEEDPTLLERLYGLDHLSTRLRRSADKLLVIAGSQEQTASTRPIELGTALRSALAEIEEYKRVRLGALCDVTVASSLASDLVLLFAELLENATASSPPGSPIEVSARIRSDESCLVLIVDHGVGMTPQQRAEENRRLLERERLDIVPTGVLGLFVVGRLARRHSLDVELVETPGGGVTALVVIPSELVVSRVPPRPDLPAVKPTTVPASALPDMPAIVIPPPRSPDDGFVWFDAEQPVAEPTQERLQPSMSRALPAAETPAADESQADTAPGGFRRRVPGAHLPSTFVAPSTGPVPEQRWHNPAATRTAMDEYQSAISDTARHGDILEQAAATAVPPAGDEGERRAGLVRRVPGATLSDDQPPQQPVPAEVAGTAWGVRNADADRRALDDLAAGLARAKQSATAGRSVHASNDGHLGDRRKESAQ
jgi:signal transduction histidine kinase